MKAAKGSSRGRYGKTSRIPVGTIVTVWSTRDREIGANIAAIRSAWAWACAEKVGKGGNL